MIFTAGIVPYLTDDDVVLFDDGFSRVGLFGGRIGFVRDGISFAWDFKPVPGRWTSLVFIGDAKGVELVADGASRGVSAGKKAQWPRRSAGYGQRMRSGRFWYNVGDGTKSDTIERGDPHLRDSVPQNNR